jgi:heptosyltransferase II
MSRPIAGRRILVRAANWVGDAIMSTPALRALRHALPHSHITLLAKPWVAPVFENNRHIDAIMLYASKGDHSGFIGLVRLAAQIRGGRYDSALLLQNAFEAAFITWLARVPRRIGYTTDGRSLFLTDRIRSWRALKKGHLIDYYMGLLEGIEVPPEGRRLELMLTSQEHQNALTSLARMDLHPPTQLIVGLNPGAAHGTAKRWPLERFAELGRRVIKRYGARLLIFGSAQEASIGESLAHELGAFSHNLAGSTSLREAFALIACCRLFVTNDSGLMHAAAALDIPQVAIIGPTDLQATAPLNALSRIVQQAGTCAKSPCLLPHCPLDHRCMTAISVDQVFEATVNLIESVT